MLKLIKYGTNVYYYGYQCSACLVKYNKECEVLYHCYKCQYNLCRLCVYKTIESKPLVFPFVPYMQSNPQNNINTNDNNVNTNDNNINHNISIINEKLRDNSNENMFCEECLINLKNIEFQPCGHISCCETCSNNLVKCPICNKEIQLRVKINK